MKKPEFFYNEDGELLMIGLTNNQATYLLNPHVDNIKIRKNPILKNWRDKTGENPFKNLHDYFDISSRFKYDEVPVSKSICHQQVISYVPIIQQGSGKENLCVAITWDKGLQYGDETNIYPNKYGDGEFVKTYKVVQRKTRMIEEVYYD